MRASGKKLCARQAQVEKIWQSVCTSIHTRAHTSPTTSMCSNLGLPSNLKPHKFLIYVCSAQRINISKKIQLFRGISSSRSSQQLADYGNPFAQVFTRAHTHQFAHTSLKRRVDTFTYMGARLHIYYPHVHVTFCRISMIKMLPHT